MTYVTEWTSGEEVIRIGPVSIRTSFQQLVWEGLERGCQLVRPWRKREVLWEHPADTENRGVRQSGQKASAESGNGERTGAEGSSALGRRLGSAPETGRRCFSLCEREADMVVVRMRDKVGS